jgi:hypothetical protein
MQETAVVQAAAEIQLMRLVAVLLAQETHQALRRLKATTAAVQHQPRAQIKT